MAAMKTFEVRSVLVLLTLCGKRFLKNIDLLWMPLFFNNIKQQNGSHTKSVFYFSFHDSNEPLDLGMWHIVWRQIINIYIILYEILCVDNNNMETVQDLEVM